MKIQASGNHNIWQRAKLISKDEGIDLTSAFYRANDAIRRESNTDAANQQSPAISGSGLPNPPSPPSWPAHLPEPLLDHRKSCPSGDLAAYLSLDASFVYNITDSEVKECKEKCKNGEQPNAFASFEAPVSFTTKFIALFPVATLLALLAWCMGWVARHIFPDPWLRWWGIAVLPWLPGVLIVTVALVLIYLFAQRATTFGYGYCDSGRIVLAFRGTQSLGDWMTDGNILPWQWPCRHLGFLLAWHSIQNQVTSWLESLDHKPTSLILTGHSLGGALAKIAAFDLAAKYTIDAVVTFGAPRIGFYRFRDAYERCTAGPDNGSGKTLGGVTFRYTHQTDIVSKLPPPVPYFHVGTEYHLLDTGIVQADPPPSRLASVETWFNNLSAAYYSSITPVGTFQHSEQAGMGVAKPVIPAPVFPLPGLAKPSARDDSTTASFGRLCERFPHLRVLLFASFPVTLTWVSLAVFFSAIADSSHHFMNQYLRAFEKRYTGARPASLIEQFIGRSVVSPGSRIKNSSEQT